MKFTKMQGIGNDYVYVNCFEETVPNPTQTAKKSQRPSFWSRSGRHDSD